MLSLKNISLRATSGIALKNVSLDIPPGECVAIIGSSGSGKTLLMELLRGERKPSTGSITADGIPLEKLSSRLLQQYRKNLGILLQEEQLIPEMTIAHNIALPLELKGMKTKEVAERVSQLLWMTKLENSCDALPEELNAGQRRLASLAQAIANDPMILLIDEPVNSEMDEESIIRIVDILQKAHSRGATVICTTNNPKSLAALNAKLVRLEKGQIVQRTEKKSKTISERITSVTATPL